MKTSRIITLIAITTALMTNLTGCAKIRNMVQRAQKLQNDRSEIDNGKPQAYSEHASNRHGDYRRDHHRHRRHKKTKYSSFLFF